MTNALISTVVAAAATFIAAGFVIQFAVGGSQAAQEELRGGVKINNVESMQQLIMYDSLIAYNCDDTGGGNLDATGDKDWDDWKTYKKAAKLADTRPSDSFTFQDLNNSFSGNELNCYGTSTSIGGRGIINDARPSSREWRNDQEGEHSRIRFTVNNTPTDQDYMEIGPCFWFNQHADVPDHNPDAGWSGLGTSGGITDMVYHFTDNTQVNAYDPFTEGDGNLQCAHDEYTFTAKGGSTGQTQMAGGPMLTVTVINTDFANSLVSSSEGTVTGDVDAAAGDRPPGPFSWSGYSLERKSFHLCEGTRGYVQTNTGYTDDKPNQDRLPFTFGGPQDPKADDGKISYQDAPSPNYYDANNHQPGVPDKEKFSDLNDPEDNSVHPFIVIEDYTC